MDFRLRGYAVSAMIPTLPTLGATRVYAHWWAPLIRGIVSILFGIAIWIFPQSSVYAVVIFFGAFAFVDGTLNIVTAVRFAHPETGRWWAILVQGIVGIAIGVITFLNPAITAATLGFLVAIWAVITGVLEIVAAIRLRQDVPGELLLFLVGGLSLVVGIWLFAHPIVAVLYLTWLIAFYAIFGGIALVALAFRLKSKHLPPGVSGSGGGTGPRINTR